jgi:hypothetical protein
VCIMLFLCKIVNMSYQDIKCPQCGHEFQPTDAIKDALQKELNQKAKKWQEDKELQYQKELQRQKLELEESLKKNIQSDFENRLKVLMDSNQLNEEKLKQAREKELMFLKREQELKNKEQEIEINIQKRLQVERIEIIEQIRNQEIEKNKIKDSETDYKLKELQKQLEDQKKLTEEMKRKQEQGSMQMQGEVQELIIESFLRESFPLDTIVEIGKGVKGADILHIVNSRIKENLGKIYIESKKTKEYQASWIEKFKVDMREKGANIGVIITHVMPKDMERMGQKEGIWVCTFNEFKGLIFALRETLIKVSEVFDSQQNKGDKMSLLYDYLVGSEFRSHIEAIVEGFTTMKEDLDSEKRRMEAMWKMREKQIEKVLHNTLQLYGSIKGIGGKDVLFIQQLDDKNDLLLTE